MRTKPQDFCFCIISRSQLEKDLFEVVARDYFQVIGRFDSVSDWNKSSLKKLTLAMLVGRECPFDPSEVESLNKDIASGIRCLALSSHPEIPALPFLKQEAGLMTLQAALDEVSRSATVKESRVKYGQPISERELEILLLVSLGRSNREIATETELNLQTIKNMLTSLMKRLKCKNRVELTIKYREGGVHTFLHAS